MFKPYFPVKFKDDWYVGVMSYNPKLLEPWSVLFIRDQYPVPLQLIKYAFTFKSKEEAQAKVDQLHGKMIMGLEL